MARFGFCGPTYQSQAVNSDAQRAINVYPEANESGQGKSSMIMLSSPGLKKFCTLPTGAQPQVRGELAFNGRLFAASDSNFCEVMRDGSKQNYGSITTDGLPVSMAANGANQILLASAGILYIFNLATNTLTAVAGAPPNIILVDYSDGFFVALTANSNLFQLSGLLDGTTWSGLFAARVSVFAENVVTMICDHRDLAVIGQKRSAIYVDSGNTFPFDVIPGGFVEQGGAAVFGRSRLDNSVFWWGADERGQGIAWRNNGYTPARISNHSVESIISRYPRISDAISYSFQQGGHTFWHTYFPSGLNDTGLPLGASWRYDAATSMWHEVGYWDSVAARYMAHRSQCHASAFGMNLVGDWKSGNIYQMDPAFVDDDGNPLRWVRRTPYVGLESQPMQHDELYLDMETGGITGQTLTGADMGPPLAPPFIILRDANGVLWKVTIDDNGNPNTVISASGSPQTIILADSSMVPSTAWQLGITIAGNLTTSAVTFSGGGYGEGGYGEGGYGAGSSFPLYPQIYQMASTPGNHLTGFLVTVDGNIQTDKPDQSRDPRVCLRWSDDGAHTWSNEHWKGVGKAGEYNKRVIWRRLGIEKRGKGRVYEVSGSDPIAWRIVDAYLKASPGFQPTERLVHQLRKGA